MLFVNIGQSVRIAVEFQNLSGVYTDPTATTFKFQTPAGVITTYTHPNANITKPSTGNFYVDLTANQEGLWYWQWAGTGTVQATDEGYFEVRDSPF
jgi:hypothetical protein